MPKVNCKNCDEKFYAKSSVIKNGYGRFCSRKCKEFVQSNRIIKNCKICNKEFTTVPSQIANGWGIFCSRKCSKTKKREDLTGKRFGRWVVTNIGYITKDKVGRSLYYYNAKCDCGTEKPVMAKSLESGHSLSCGCLVKDTNKKPLGVACISILYAQYRHGAKNRNIIFDISKDEFKKIVIKNCYYCDGEPKLRAERLQSTVSSRIPLNGIDRINNSIGYSIENCVPCCMTCNRMKLSLGVNDFLYHIEKIHHFQKNKDKEFPLSYLTVVS